jgi:hypothetical protein
MMYFVQLGSCCIANMVAQGDIHLKITGLQPSWLDLRAAWFRLWGGSYARISMLLKAARATSWPGWSVRGFGKISESASLPYTCPARGGCIQRVPDFAGVGCSGGAHVLERALYNPDWSKWTSWNFHDGSAQYHTRGSHFPVFCRLMPFATCFRARKVGPNWSECFSRNRCLGQKSYRESCFNLAHASWKCHDHYYEMMFDEKVKESQGWDTYNLCTWNKWDFEFKYAAYLKVVN